jgi:hypothetical protein
MAEAIPPTMVAKIWNISQTQRIAAPETTALTRGKRIWLTVMRNQA